MAPERSNPSLKSKVTPSKACRNAFLEIIEPELLSWNLRRHPSPTSHYGGSDHGYTWDFLDMTVLHDVRAVAVSIINPGQQLVVEGLRYQETTENPADLPLVYGNSKGVFRLTRKWSIKRPLTGLIFKFESRKGQAVQEAANTLMLELKGRLPILHEYLYGQSKP